MAATLRCLFRKAWFCSMKRIAVLLFLLAAFPAALLCQSRQENGNSEVKNQIDSKLEEYFEAIKYESIPVKSEECDFLIESCTDSLLRQEVGYKILSHYMSSKIMGDEDVAILVFRKWYENGLLKMPDESEFYSMKLLADLSRRSLIGCPAPKLEMETPDGSFCEFPGTTERYKVLFFYDTECPDCKIQTILLRNTFESEDFPVDFYAVYTGSMYSAWTEFIEKQFDIASSNLRVTHLWDAASVSDFPAKYGVISTPKMFLVDPRGIIVGRGLDALALTAMLMQIFTDTNLDYGSEKSEEFYDSVFSYPDEVSAEQVRGIADYIAVSTLEKKDTVMFRQMSGDLLYYLSERSGEGYNEGMSYLIDKYIMGRNDIWKSEDDSLKIIGVASIFADLFSKAKPGTKIADMSVEGTLLTRNRTRHGKFNLRKLGGSSNVILFYTESCPHCQAEKAALEAQQKSLGRSKVLLVNIDKCGCREELLENFDLSSTPLLVLTDKKAVILRRYFSMIEK